MGLSSSLVLGSERTQVGVECNDGVEKCNLTIHKGESVGDHGNLV